jgi:hypothetical protein
MRKLKKKPVTNQAPKTSGTPVEIYNSPEEQFGLPVTPSVAPLINTGYSDYDLDPFYDNPRIRELRAANDAMLQQAHQEYNEYAWDKKIEEYYDKFAQSKKTDKISPLETLPLDNLTPELEEELKAQGFFINKTKTEAQLFPEDVIQKRVIDNGFRENQFSNYWGLDAKQVKQQYGDLFKAADQQYEATVLNKVLTESVKQGKSPDQIFNTLPKSWGVTSELKKKYLNKSQEELQKVIKQVNTQLEETAVGKNWNWLFEGNKDPEETFNSTYYTKADGSPDWDKINARDKRIEEAKKNVEKVVQSDLDINKRTPGKDSDQFSNFNPLDNDLLKAQRRGLVNAAGEQAASEPFNQAQQEYTGQLAQEAALSLIQNKLSQAQLDNNFDEQARILGALQTNKISEILSDQEISDAVNNNLFWKNQQGTITASDPLRQDLNWLDKTQDALTYFPDFLKQGTGMWDGESLSYRDRKEIEKSTGIDMGTDKDNLVGDALNTFNPLRLGYESRKNIEAGRYGDLALDLATTFSPFYAGKLAQGLGRGANAVLKYSPVKSMPWLNLQNAVIDPYFAYESVKPGGYFNEAYDNFAEGNIASGIGNTAFGAMGVLPYVKPAVNTLKTIRNLSKPGYEGQMLSSLPGGYGLKYTAPSSSTVTFGAVPKMQTAEEFQTAVKDWKYSPEAQQFTRSFGKEFHPNTRRFSLLDEEGQAAAQAASQRFSQFKKGENVFGPSVQFVNGKLVRATQSPVGGLNLGKLGRFDLIKSGQSELGLKEALLNESSLLSGAGDISQTRTTNGLPKTLDTEIPLYRVEPEGITFPTDKFSSEYLEWDHGPTSEMSEEGINSLLQQSNNLKYTDNTGVERIGNFFPQHTAGNWWSNVPIGTPGAPDYVTAKFAEVGNEPTVGLTTNVPFSQLNKFSVKNDPQAMGFVGVPDKEFILPNEFKQKAIINYRTGAPSATGKLGAADDITEVEQLEDGLAYSPIDDEIAVQIGDDLRARKMERWQSPEGQRRLQQMIDNTPSLQGLTPNDYVETLAKANSWNRQRNDATIQLTDAKQELAKLKEENSYTYGDIYESGQTPSKELVEELTAREELVKTKIDGLENTLSSLEQSFPTNLAYWNTETQTYAIDPSKVTAADAKIIAGHELAGHTLGSPSGQVGSTYLDDALSKLDLVKGDEITKRTLNNIAPTGQLSILDQPSGAYEAYGPGGFGDDYIDKAINYWETGSQGTEKVPFAVELVEDMLAKGLIKSEYDKITPDLIKKHFNDYMNTRGNKYPLRIYDIMEGKNKNFKLITDVLNNLPTIAAGAIAADAIMGDDDNKEEDVANAGLLMLFGKFGKEGRAAKSILSKLQRGEKLKKTPVIGAAYKFLRSGYDKLSGNEKKLLDQIIDLERVKIDEKLAGNMPSYGSTGYNPRNEDYYGSNLDSKTRTQLELDFRAGTLDPQVFDTYVRLGKAAATQALGEGNPALDAITNKEHFLSGISSGGKYIIPDTKGSIAMLHDKINYIQQERLDLVSRINAYIDKTTPEYKEAQDRLSELNRKLDIYANELGNYELQGESIIDSSTMEAPWLKQSINTGSGYITDLSSGKLVSVTNKLPQTSMIYTLTDRTTEGAEEISKSMEHIAGGLDPVAEQTVTNNINLTLEALPGAKPYGSSVLVSGLQIPHLANDVDVMMTDKDLAKVSGNMEYLGKKTPTSPALQYQVFPDAGKAGVIDVNLIVTGPDGLAMDDPQSSVQHATKTFRQFFPEEFAAEAKAAALEGRPIKIPYTPEQLMERFDPLEKSVMDAYESDPNVNEAAEKQRYRPDVIVSFTAEDKLDKVASGQLKYIKSLVGENGNLGRQFPEEAFSDVAKNLQILNDMNYMGARSVIAKSPKRMQLALNDYYINKTTFVREIDPDRIKNAASKEEGILSAFQDWDPRFNGGTARGIGLNSQELGKIGHVGGLSSYPILGNRQLNVIGNGKHADYTLDLNDPRDYVAQIKHEMGEGLFTPAEREQLNKIYNETIGKGRGQEISVEDTWMFPNELIDQPMSNYAKQPIYISNSEADAGIEFLNRLNSELGLRAIKSLRTYGTGLYASTISKIDDTIDGIMYGAVSSMPKAKSWAQRTQMLSALTKSQIDRAKRQLPVDTVKNFKKVKNLLQSGIKDIKEERDELIELTKKLENAKDEKAGKYISKSKKWQSLVEEGDSAQVVIDKFNQHMINLTAQQFLLQRRVQDIEGFKDSLAVFLVAITSIGTAGAVIKALHDKNEKQQERHQKENKKYFDEMLPEMIEKGKAEEFLQDYLEVMGPNRRSWRKYKNDKGWDKKKFGGSTGIDLELTQQEIDDLTKQGYKVVQR